ncbi:tetratricopeptide repeat protein [Pleionea sediminis]|uniref:tetratricopeptide repeat protein n=1 Tax=Pleionea sediminis TaxID=2569479 RepID=UPI0011856E4D|nr:tetratricopeptide repeat protein [Pleionea sediminis]
MRSLKIITYSFIFITFALSAHGSTKGEEFFEQGKLEESKEIWQKALESDNQNNKALFYLARIAYEQNDLDLSEDYFEQSLELKPNSAEEYYWFGRMSSRQATNASIFTALGYAEDAENAFIQAIKQDDSHLLAYKGLFNFYLEAPSIAGGSEENAKKLISKINALSREEGQLTKLKFYEKTDKKKHANQIALDLLKAQDVSAKVKFRSAMILQSNELFGDAFIGFQSIVKQPQTESNALYWKASIYQIGRTSVISDSKYDIGISAFNQYLTLELSDKLPSKQWASFRLSQLLKASGQNDKAIKIIEQLKTSQLSDVQLIEKVKNF